MKEAVLKVQAKKILAGIRAAVTSPEAVTAERSLAALIVVRVALSLGASASLVELVRQMIVG